MAHRMYSTVQLLSIENFKKESWKHRIGGLNWKLEASLSTVDHEFLTVKIFCNERNLSPLWSCSAAIRLSLLTFYAENRVSGQETVMKIDKFTFNSSENYVEKNELKKLADLRNPTNSYLSNGVITLVLEISDFQTSGIRTIPRFDFTKPNSQIFDTIIQVAGSKLYVGSHVLTANSQFFREMLSDKSKEEVNVIDNVKVEDFIELLNVLYNTTDVQKTDIPRLLKLASRFCVDGVVFRCEKLLMNGECLDVLEKLMISEQCGLSELQNHSIRALKTQNQFRELFADARYQQLGKATQNAIFNRMLAIVGGASVDDEDSIDESCYSLESVDNSLEELKADSAGFCDDIITLDATDLLLEPSRVMDTTDVLNNTIDDITVLAFRSSTRNSVGSQLTGRQSAVSNDDTMCIFDDI